MTIFHLFEHLLFSPSHLMLRTLCITAIIGPTLQIRNLKLRDFKSLSQVHTTIKWQNYDPNQPRSANSQSFLFAF